jgi:beta-glucosidase
MKRFLLVPVALLALALPSFSNADPAPTNLARGAVATASSAESSAYSGDMAIDGDLTTRWSSAFSDPQTLELDLGARASISEIKLTWEAAFGSAYTLEVSNDRSTWTNVETVTAGDGGTDDFTGLTATGRYVRLTGTQRATPYGYSVYEFEVDGTFLDEAVSVGASAYQLPEKNGTIQVPVRLNKASDTPVTVDYSTADGTATAGHDYTAASGTLTFAPGETEKMVTLTSIDDSVDEPNETFDLNLANASSGVTIGPRTKATVTVVDDDETAFSGATKSIRDFEGTLTVLPAPVNNVGLFTFSGDAGSTPTLTTSPDTAPGSTGTQSMHLAANVTSYGGFSDDFASSQDWTSYDGFSFWFKGTNTGKSIEFEIKDGGTDGEHGELWNSHVTDDSTQWKLVRVPFASFTRRTDYQPGGGPTDGVLNLTNMWGWAMNLPSGAEAYSIDDVQVYQQVVTVEDFEGAKSVRDRGISVFNGNNAPPTLAIESQPRDGTTDNHALKVDYDIPSGQYGGFTQDLTDAQDWSAFKGFRFWYFGRERSSAAPARVYLEIKDGGTGPGASELWNTSFLDDTIGWHQVSIPFSQFAYRTDYQPVGGINHTLDLTKMWGYAVTVPPGDHGSFDWDDVQVYGVAGAPADVNAATDKPVYLANEGDTVNVGVQVTTRDGQPLKNAVSVGYSTTGGTATPIDDYESTSGMLSFDAGAVSGSIKTFPVHVLTDAAPEVAETIGIKLTSTDVGVPSAASNVVINANGLPYLDSSLPIETRINDLLSRMTQAEKVGQMTQAERQAVTTPSDIATYNLGSLLSGGGSVPTPNTPTSWADMVDGFQLQAMQTRLQIPLIYGVDAVHGHNNVYGATLFPHNVGMGATRDPALGEQEGVVTAQETKATGVPWAFAPCLCVSRDERWGRAYESFGEDPALVEQMETFVTGLQANGVLATAKHFAGDGGTVYGTSTTGTYKIDQGVTQISRADMERLHLAPFAEAVKRGVGSVMPSYSSVDYTDDGLGNPVKMHANGDLINTWLKDQHGFDGFVISDWQAIDQLGGDYAKDITTSVNAGLDMIMVPYQYPTFEQDLTSEVAAGRIAQSRIDDAVKRILREKFRAGLFEHPFADRTHIGEVGSDAHRAVARKAAAESQVLLKNDGVLPLSKTAKIYVAGSNADDLGNQTGGWTITWQGGSGTTTVGTTILQGIKQVAPGATVTYSKDASAPTTGNDVGVVVVGETPYAEGVGDIGNGRADLSLTAADRTAIDRVCAAMKCVVLVVSGRPMLVSDKLAAINGLVASWLPGTEGEGVADTLFGDKPFTGRLPVTWARSMAQIPINVGDATYDPAFPFGWGLRTDAPRPRLDAARAALAGGDAHAQAAASGIANLLAAPDWLDDGSVANPGDVLTRLASIAKELDQTDADTFAIDDEVVSVARDLAQAAIVYKGIAADTSALTADADHSLLSGDTMTAVVKLAQASVLASTSEPGQPGGDVPPTLTLAIGPGGSFGSFTPGVAHTYTAAATATVLSTAGSAMLSVADPSAQAPGHLVNGTYVMPQALKLRATDPATPNTAFAPLAATPTDLLTYFGPVTNDPVTLEFQQAIGLTDALRTGNYSKTLTFTLSTTTP